MKKSLFILLAAGVALTACNSEKKGPGGSLYVIHKEGGSKEKIKEGDFIKIDFIQKNDKDSIIYSSYDTEQPVIFPVKPKQHAGDMNDILVLLSEGDSVTFKLNIDTVAHYTNQPKPEQFKNDKYLSYTMKIHKVFAKKANEADSTFDKRTNEYFQEDYKKNVELKKNTEDAKIKKYIADNNLKTTTTASGLQYVIEKQGSGEKAVLGDTAMVNYTGKFTNKKVNGKENIFESSVAEVAKKNLPPNPMKTYGPVPIPLGEGIAKGFVEAIQLIGKGGKIIAIMPSKLAYGENGGGPIGPYTPLVFEIEVTDIKKGIAPTVAIP